MAPQSPQNAAVFQPLPFFARLWLAWVCFFRVLFDGNLAARAKYLFASGELANDPNEPHTASRATSNAPMVPAAPRASSPVISTEPALLLLTLLQRQGRLVDFLKQDIAGFSDGDVGAVARVVHDGCRKALERHLQIKPIRDEPEGKRLELAKGFDPSEIKLSGNVQGEPPYHGVLRHRGWRASDLELPVSVAGHNPSILEPAEVEL